ncbi:MAG: dihydrofolate reductase, partial [Betaproteobacteria bacterium]
VVTRQRDWRCEGALAVDSLEWGCALCAGMTPTPDELWVIGGAQLFGAAMALASRAIVTELDRDFAGDVFAPKLEGRWHETARESHAADDGMRFAFVTYERGSGANLVPTETD